MSFNSKNINHNIKSPCKNCSSRYLGCHSQCGNYTSYKNNVAQINKARFNERRINRDYREVMKYGYKNGW